MEPTNIPHSKPLVMLWVFIDSLNPCQGTEPAPGALGLATSPQILCLLLLCAVPLWSLYSITVWDDLGGALTTQVKGNSEEIFLRSVTWRMTPHCELPSL